MTKKQFSEALKIATSDRDLSGVDDSNLFGCGCADFVFPVYCTVDAVAKLLRWQVCSIFSNSTIADAQELDNMAHIARRKFQII